MPKSVKLYFDNDHSFACMHIDNTYIPKIQDTRYFICPFVCTITRIYV